VNILYVCADLGVPVLGAKGASIHVRAMADALAAEGHRVVVVAGQLTKSPWQTPAPMAAAVVHVPPTPDIVHVSARLRAFSAAVDARPAAAGEVRRALYSQELLAQLRVRFEHAAPDVVYERASLFGVAGLTFAREIGVPHLLELNAPLADEQQRYRGGGALQELAEQAESWLLHNTDAVLAVSDSLGEYVCARGVDRARVQVVPNGVDTARFAPGSGAPVRARLRLADKPVLGFVGGLRPWHGVEHVPGLIAALQARHPGAHALIVGDGPLRGGVLREVERLGVQDHVTLAGAVDHEAVPDYIRAFDVALAPYPAAAHDFYFSPLKVFEYFACGVPVAAARRGQLADLVRDGQTGQLYTAGDLDALVACCDAMLSNRERAREMGRRAAALVRSQFTWAHNARRVAELAGSLRHPREVCA
jgi:glycosyltransferase involved in cell wall biosynthesis